jgi:hypothetical protein
VAAYPIVAEFGGLSRALLAQSRRVILADRVGSRLLPGLLVPLVSHDAILTDTSTLTA